MENLLLLHELIYRPIFNLLIIFLQIFGGNLGLAIIFLTLTIRSAMIKQTLAGNDMQKGMSDLQPKLQEIQKKYKDDPQRLSKETMKVFKTKGKWPLKGCLMMLIQIPVFIGLFYVIKHFAADSIDPNSIYSFLRSFGQKFTSINAVNTNFFWLDLLAKNNIGLTIFAALFTFLQMKLTNIAKPPSMPKMWKDGKAMPDMSKMMWFMGIFMAFIMGSFVYSTQSGVGLYIATTTLFSTLQYSIQYRAVLKTKIQAFLAGAKKGKPGKPQIVEKAE